MTQSELTLVLIASFLGAIFAMAVTLANGYPWIVVVIAAFVGLDVVGGAVCNTTWTLSVRSRLRLPVSAFSFSISLVLLDSLPFSSLLGWFIPLLFLKLLIGHAVPNQQTTENGG